MVLWPQAHIQYMESLCGIIYGIISGIWNQVLPRGLYKSPVLALYLAPKLSLQYSSQYTEFHLEYVDYDLRTYDTLATHQRTSDSVQEVMSPAALGWSAFLRFNSKSLEISHHVQSK